MKRRLFRDRLKEDLRNLEFKRAFEAEDLPARLALRIAELRQQEGLSQAELAKRLGAKQQLIARSVREEVRKMVGRFIEVRELQ